MDGGNAVGTLSSPSPPLLSRNCFFSCRRFLLDLLLSDRLPTWLFFGLTKEIALARASSADEATLFGSGFVGMGFVSELILCDGRALALQPELKLPFRYSGDFRLVTAFAVPVTASSAFSSEVPFPRLLLFLPSLRRNILMLLSGTVGY